MDLQNPRIPEHVKEHGDASSIRSYLLDKENVESIAKSITSNGYHRSATSIVYENNGKYTVLDGNRRLAACQLLMNPTLIADAKLRSRFERMKKDLDDDTFDNVPITVAPSRKDAEKEIWDIHVSKLLKPWQVLQQLRMYRNLIETGDYSVSDAASEYGITVGTFKNELAKLYFYEQILELTDDAGEDELLRSGFNKIDRLMLSKNGKKLLEYEVDDSGEVNFDDQDGAKKHIGDLVPYIVTPGRISAQVNQEQLIEQVYSQISPEKFPSKDKPKTKQKKNEKKDEPKKSGSSSGTHSKRDWITDAEYKQYSGADKVKDLLNELKKNPPKRGQNLNIVAVSLRILVELAVYHALNERGILDDIITAKKDEINKKKARANQKPPKGPIAMAKNWTPSLKEMLSHMANEANGVIKDPQQRKALDNFLSKQKEFVNDMDNFIHNVQYKPSETAVKEIWDSFCRPVFDILSKISSQNKNDKNKSTT